MYRLYRVYLCRNNSIKEISPLKSMDYSNETVIQLQNRYVNISREIKTSIQKTVTAQTKKERY